MKLIADAGSTKTLWYLCSEDAIIATQQTQGCNPSTLNNEQLHRLFNEDWLPLLSALFAETQSLYFYGAGCASDAAQARMHGLFSQYAPHVHHTEINSDMLAAARALWGEQAGICAILGTGSNSCVYDGKKITLQLPSLGYLLGDEGGGCDMGKRLIQAYFYEEMPAHLRLAFANDYPDFSREQLLEQLYRQPAPNAYLASFVPFIRKYKADAFCKDLVYGSLAQFFDRILKAYKGYKSMPIGFIGSVAAVFSEEIYHIAQINEIKINKILTSPFPELLNFYINT